ncbi:MAG: DUF4097 family beta strand repeat protein, partial [Planctomycetes bacterium]|nr:DUF4097 family beta strand repeat protein [Planctomycetota bacterium]
MRPSIIFLLLFAFCTPAWAALSDDRRVLPTDADYERTMDSEIDVDGVCDVFIDHSMGYLEVETWDKSTIHVWAHVEVQGEDAEEFGEAIAVDIDVDKNNARIITRYPGGFGDETSYGVGLKVCLPRGSSLDLNIDFGDATVSGLFEKLKADVSNGAITTKGVRSMCRILSSYGSVYLEDCGGKVDIKGADGGIQIHKFRGLELKVSSGFGAIEVNDAKGKVVLSSSDGGVRVLNVTGEVKVQNIYGGIRMEDIKGECRVESNDGGVRLMNIEGDVSMVEVIYGGLDIEG